MRAMILAAGFGSRLHPLTSTIPKALAPIGGVPLLEIVLKQLELQGFSSVVINAHYRAEQINDFLTEYKKRSKIEFFFSYEPTILNTGGGIKKMLNFFDETDSVLVHNVDIITNIDYCHLFNSHSQAKAQATLVVNERQTSRPLAFNDDNIFLGRSKNVKTKAVHYGFCGIQVIEPALFRNIATDDFYSIDIYEEAALNGEKITCYNITGQYWKDIGRLADIDDAGKDLERGLFRI